MRSTLTINEVELVVEYDISPYTAAKTNGDPNDCHEEEGGEVEIESVTLEGVEIMTLLADEIIEQIEEKCYEIAESDEGDYPGNDDDE